MSYSKATGQRFRRIRRSEYRMDGAELARYLVGTILVREIDGVRLRARITETEAYLGPADLASHSSKGRTSRTEVMFGPAGRAYVYLIYGIYDMFNVVCGQMGSAHAVLIRAAQPLDDWSENLKGPGRLARAMRITRLDNGLDLCGDTIWFERDPRSAPVIQITPRIGIDYAKEWRDAPLRFLELDSGVAPKPRRPRTRLARPTSIR